MSQENPKPMTPEMRELARLKKLAAWMDSAIEIPGTKQRVGLDSLVGLVPVVGDFGTAAVSFYIVREAMKFGIPKRLVVAMTVNVLIDALLGSIPILGDLFDLGFKANMRNVAMLDKYLRSVDRE